MNNNFLNQQLVVLPRSSPIYIISLTLQGNQIVPCIYKTLILVLPFHRFAVSYAIAFKSIIRFFMGGCVANKSAHQPSFALIFFPNGSTTHK